MVNKVLLKLKIDGLKKKILYPISIILDVELYLIGIFDTEKVFWTFYVISVVDNKGDISLTNEVCKISTSTSGLNNSSIISSGKKFSDKSIAIKWMEDFKAKWECGDNSTTSEERDKKLKDILEN